MCHAGIQGEEAHGMCIYSFASFMCHRLTLSLLQLDCGIHPGLSGMDALPFIDIIEANEVDLLLISQYVSLSLSQ